MGGAATHRITAHRSTTRDEALKNARRLWRAEPASLGAFVDFSFLFQQLWSFVISRSLQANGTLVV